jgi:hypothetical protein
MHSAMVLGRTAGLIQHNRALTSRRLNIPSDQGASSRRRRDSMCAPALALAPLAVAGRRWHPWQVRWEAAPS